MKYLLLNFPYIWYRILLETNYISDAVALSWSKVVLSDMMV